MKRILVLAAIILTGPWRLCAAPPAITSFDNGTVVWTNSTAIGYCMVEWVPSVTGSWARSWQGLFDIPSVNVRWCEEPGSRVCPRVRGSLTFA